MKNGIKIVEAIYIKDYIIKLTFNDGKINNVDFKEEVMAQKVPEYKKYQHIKEFKRFKIESGNLVWGKNWDLIFPLYKLYENSFV
jgi:hypothetical protein